MKYLINKYLPSIKNIIKYFLAPGIFVVFFSFLLFQTHKHFKAKQINNFVQEQKLLLDIFENSFRQFLDVKINDYKIICTELAELYSNSSTQHDQAHTYKILGHILEDPDAQTNWIAFYNADKELISDFPTDVTSNRVVPDQNIYDYLNNHEVFIRSRDKKKNEITTIDIIINTTVGEENYLLVANFNINVFIRQHIPLLEPYKDIYFFLINEDGTIFSILNMEHDFIDIMEKGNAFMLGEECLSCHKQTDFDDIKQAFEYEGHTHYEYTNPDGDHQFRTTEVYQFYNRSWGISICHPFSFVLGVIEDNARLNIILVILFVLIMVIGGYLSHRVNIKNTVLKATKSQTARLNKLFENEIVGILEIENDGTIIKTNEKFQKLFDVTDTEALGKNLNTLLSQNKSDVEDQIKPVQKAMSENTITRERYVRKDGKLLNIFKIEIPIVVDTKLIARYIVFQDVTEIKKTEEQRLWAMSAIRNSKDAINITDINDNILFANAGFEKMYQYNYDEVIGKNIFDFVRTKEDRSQNIDEVTSITRTEGGWQGEKLNIRRDGTVFPIYLSTAPIKDKKGTIIGSVGISTDITKQKTAERELQENEKKYRTLSGKLSASNDLKNLLLDIITHDLKNPIGTAQGFTEMLAHSYSDIEELSYLKDSIDQSLRIIVNVTNLAKIEVGDQIEMTNLDISQMVREVLSRFKRTLEEKQIIVDNQIQEKIEIQANPIISEILDNYISNAIKYGGSGRSITLIAEKSSTHITIRVNDLGQTIDKKFRDKVFKRKIQLEGSLKGGRGLGLSIVKKIADAHHADVGVEPNNPQGNSFFVKIPK